MGDSGGSPEDQTAERNVVSKDVFMEFQMEMRTLFGFKVKPVCVACWKEKTCVHVVCVLRLCGRQSLNVMN
jgi:hypothetical protein